MLEIPVRLKPLMDWLVYVLIRVFICIIQTLRIETCQTIARVLSFLACDVARLRYCVVDENVRHVFPNWDPRARHRFMRRMWEHLFLMVAEVAHVRRHDSRDDLAPVRDISRQAADRAIFVRSAPDGLGHWPLWQFRGGRVCARDVRIPIVHDRAGWTIRTSIDS